MATNIARVIGERIREIRQKKGLTLQDLSRKTRISISMLSKIEKCQTLPPISTYANIASALEAPLGDLILNGENQDEVSLVKAGERPLVSAGSYRASPLAYRMRNKKMEPFIFHYPESEKFSEFRHQNEELIFIIEGAIEFKYRDKIVVLEEGDCIYLKPYVPHGSRPLNNKKAVAIVVQTSY